MNGLTLLRRVAVMLGALWPGLIAAMSLPAIFGDHMVLQQGKRVPVWGTSGPGAMIRVEFGGQAKSARADDNGNWRVDLDPLPASAVPRTLVVQAGAGETERRIINDVLVGEVWLCSGQSNMFWPLGKISNQRGSWPGIQNGEEEVANANWPLIRLNCADDHEFGLAGWRVCTPENARGFSATAYFFGRELHRQLGVPIGLINRSIGGTSLQAWTPKPELEALPFIRRNTELLREVQPRIQQWTREFAAYRKAAKAGGAPRPRRPDPLPDEIEVARKLQNHGELHERHIAPLVPFALRGGIWYQGESNSAPAALAAAYGEMLEALIAGRRRLWSEPDQPFYFVQLPIFSKADAGEHWHLVREGMRRVHQRVPHTGMVVTYDFSDSTLLHPPQKQEVGRRLARWALARDYGKQIAYSGPLFRAVRFERAAAVVEFDHGEGLQSSDGRPLRGFEVAGADGRFHAAAAEIRGGTVMAQSSHVPAPRHVRFFFGGFEPPNLCNAAGLPASPFTTEDL